ncbi:hypothetical protein EDC04DRAFT_2821461 [Pisolithus marmoratus]|nr:hypothetical protein EDC04DRAFT_2821461 [Pisolithus marmoratus]
MFSPATLLLELLCTDVVHTCAASRCLTHARTKRHALGHFQVRCLRLAGNGGAHQDGDFELSCSTDQGKAAVG